MQRYLFGASFFCEGMGNGFFAGEPLLSAKEEFPPRPYPKKGGSYSAVPPPEGGGGTDAATLVWSVVFFCSETQKSGFLGGGGLGAEPSFSRKKVPPPEIVPYPPFLASCLYAPGVMPSYFLNIRVKLEAEE